jgi:hypothetical protein
VARLFEERRVINRHDLNRLNPEARHMYRKAAVVAGAAMLASTAAPATGATLQTYDFYDCVGPAGTPTSFTASKTSLPAVTGAPVSAAAAFRLTDRSAVFVVLSFGEDNFSPPGIGVAGNATTTCSVDLSNGTAEFSGILVATP